MNEQEAAVSEDLVSESSIKKDDIFTDDTLEQLEVSKEETADAARDPFTDDLLDREGYYDLRS